MLYCAFLISIKWSGSPRTGWNTIKWNFGQLKSNFDSAILALQFCDQESFPIGVQGEYILIHDHLINLEEKKTQAQEQHTFQDLWFEVSFPPQTLNLMELRFLTHFHNSFDTHFPSCVSINYCRIQSHVHLSIQFSIQLKSGQLGWLNKKAVIQKNAPQTQHRAECEFWKSRNTKRSSTWFKAQN